MAVTTKEHLKQIQVGKLEAKLHKVQEELTKEQSKAAKTKTNKKAAKKAKAAKVKAKTDKAAARSAVKKSDIEHCQQIREEQAVGQESAQYTSKQAAVNNATAAKHVTA